MKISYKKIKCNIDWDHVIIDDYYGLAATEFLSAEELTADRVFTILWNAKLKREEVNVGS